MVKDRAIQLKNERDSFERKYIALKKKVGNEDERYVFLPARARISEQVFQHRLLAVELSLRQLCRS
jgi:hypothetical protein